MQISHGTGRRLERFVDHQSMEKCISLTELCTETFTPMQAPVAHDGTGQINPRSDREFAASIGNIPRKQGRMFSTLDRSPSYLCHSGACRMELQRGRGGGSPGTGS